MTIDAGPPRPDVPHSDGAGSDGSDDAVRRAVDEVLPRHLAEFGRRTGLPVVFGGSTHAVAGERQLTISRLSGTYGESLRLLNVVAGRGLGGAAMVRAIPCRVTDYASTTGITHDYDHVVVGRERLTSILAQPVVVAGAVRAVVYGAVRDDGPIGDVAVRNAVAATARFGHEVTGLLARRARPEPLAPTAAGALDELAELARSTGDPALRARLARIHDELTGRNLSPAPQPGVPGPSLTPREVQALRLVETGASNAEIAAELGITVVTVKAYLHSAMRKLDAGNRVRAVVTARTAGLL
ncbi:helix-turn-helix transcriptional regulator [Pseudonocardia phyllosphaerae]|uniref:helix-turn-helix transcriptional regulator n=1 Tax=Pseudonocardia phyllosphaerae TaxID=3390502 RepID=UPI0039780D9E